jgi:hypothetical protein
LERPGEKQLPEHVRPGPHAVCRDMSLQTQA